MANSNKTRYLLCDAPSVEGCGQSDLKGLSLTTETAPSRGGENTTAIGHNADRRQVVAVGNRKAELEPLASQWIVSYLGRKDVISRTLPRYGLGKHVPASRVREILTVLDGIEQARSTRRPQLETEAARC